MEPLHNSDATNGKNGGGDNPHRDPLGVIMGPSIKALCKGPLWKGPLQRPFGKAPPVKALYRGPLYKGSL